MADYARLIDAETWAFIRETESWYAPDSAAQSVAEQRRRYDAMCRAFFAGYPEGVSARDLDIDVPVRRYHARSGGGGATVLFAHGGAFLLGGLDSHDDICAEICAGTGFDVLAVDYRLHPEFGLRDAFEDMQAALDWLRRDRGGKVVCVGDSAGGYLAAGIVHANRRAGDVVGQVLIYPGLNGNAQGGSLDEHAHAPLLSRAEIMDYRQLLGIGTLARARGHRVPLREDDFAGLPVTVAMSAQCDPVADDARLYCERITAAAGHAIWFEDKGLVHGHLRARHRVGRARASFERVLRAITLIGAGGPVTREAIAGGGQANSDQIARDFT